MSRQQRRLLEQGAAQRDQSRGAVQNRRDALRAQIEVARTELRALEASRLANIEDFRRQALAASDFQKQRNDPLSRMTAYQELKNDPKDGATITLFSWMTKFLVIFLEIVPVVAKMFFSPPSVYAAKIQAQVERERRKAMLENQQMLVQESEEDGRLQDSQIWVDRSSEETRRCHIGERWPFGAPRATRDHILNARSSISNTRTTTDRSLDKHSSAGKPKRSGDLSLTNRSSMGNPRTRRSFPPQGRSPSLMQCCRRGKPGTRFTPVRQRWAG